MSSWKSILLQAFTIQSWGVYHMLFNWYFGGIQKKSNNNKIRKNAQSALYCMYTKVYF